MSLKMALSIPLADILAYRCGARWPILLCWFLCRVGVPCFPPCRCCSRAACRPWLTLPLRKPACGIAGRWAGPTPALLSCA